MPSLPELLERFHSVIPSLITLTMVFSFVAGLFFIMRGIMAFKQFGASLTQMSRPGELGGPLTYIAVGAILIYLPTTVETVHYTVFGFGDTYLNRVSRAAQGIYGYGSGAGVDEKWESLKVVVLKYVNFIGFIAFVRGWFIVSKAGQPGIQPGTISRGLTHIIAGIIAINVQQFIAIIKTTLGV